ncbi:hypothetical protein LTR64_001232 [Lithohypha guttulata]|uniref:uncharacterized protein n=1 Tax=Lithohypha guttulata TaxID=1690604 RepID=UPI002DDDF2A0|nr:hypothetical protein LTR51_003426 [Lithohypha guttulata]
MAVTTTETIAAPTSVRTSCSSSLVKLSPYHLGICRATAEPAPGAISKANELLQKNHNEWHVLFQDKAGHNHMAHSILTCLALGATPEEIQRAHDDLLPIQRVIPPVDHALVDRLYNDEVFRSNMGNPAQYGNFLTFFRRRIDETSWREVVHQYVFSKTWLAEVIFSRMYDGAYHPIIHLGLGMEFEQPAIIAEGLAQAAVDDDSHIGRLLFECEAAAAKSGKPAVQRPLIELLHEVRKNETIRYAPKWEQFPFKMRDGIVAGATPDMTAIAKQFTVTSDNLERRTAEMMSTCAYMAAAAQRPGKKNKIDFFYMHAVTSSIFLPVVLRQSWISLEDKMRLVEWKGRADLAWYAFSGCAALDRNAMTEYEGPLTKDMGWDNLFAAVRKEHDDGHIAKFIRAVKHGEEISQAYEKGEWADAFPVNGDMWLKVACMSLDTTKDLPKDQKWVFGTGFDQAWKRPDLL